MKKLLVMQVIILILGLPALTLAEDFLGVPIMPGGRVVASTRSMDKRVYDVSYEQVLSYYQEVLKNAKDLKLRDRKSEVAIDDNGRLAWHRISISKDSSKESDVTITKDSWTWILGTLALRFIGVFVVLMILFLCMKFEMSLIARWVRRKPR
jgi:hypothetical protein